MSEVYFDPYVVYESGHPFNVLSCHESGYLLPYTNVLILISFRRLHVLISFLLGLSRFIFPYEFVAPDMIQSPLVSCQPSKRQSKVSDIHF